MINEKKRTRKSEPTEVDSTKGMDIDDLGIASESLKDKLVKSTDTLPRIERRKLDRSK